MESSMEKAEKRVRTVKPSLLTDILFLLLKTASIVLVLLLIFTFLFGIARQADASMAPAVKDGDLLIFFRHMKNEYQPRDTIVLGAAGEERAGRVVAVAGDEVDITDEGLIINGALQQEQEIYQKTERYRKGVGFPLTVPQGEVFILGDNREGAADSRIYGCVKQEDTLGKVMMIIRRRGI